MVVTRGGWLTFYHQSNRFQVSRELDDLDDHTLSSIPLPGDISGQDWAQISVWAASCCQRRSRSLAVSFLYHYFWETLRAGLSFFLGSRRVFYLSSDCLHLSYSLACLSSPAGRIEFWKCSPTLRWSWFYISSRAPSAPCEDCEESSCQGRLSSFCWTTDFGIWSLFSHCRPACF